MTIAFNPDTAGWSWADFDLTEAEAQRIPVSAEVEAYSAKKAAPAIRGLIANPGITILQRFADELVAMGVTVRYVDGWGSRGYLPINPVGLINHWIVSTYQGAARQQTLGLIVRGHSTLAGPLANIYMDFDGTVYIVAALSANHGGVGSWREVSGNSRWFGMECEGGPLLQPAQVRALPLVNAAMSRALGRDPAVWMIGHHEYAPTRKVDIGKYMPPARAEAVRIVAGESPRPLTKEDDDMTPEQSQQLNAVYEYLMEQDRAPQGWSYSKQTANAVDDISNRLRIPGYPFDYLPHHTHLLEAIADAVSAIKPAPTDVEVDEAVLAEEIVARLGEGYAKKVADELSKRLAS